LDKLLWEILQISNVSNAKTFEQRIDSWVRRKYKKLKNHKKVERWLGKVARNKPEYFAHWKMGILPAIE